MSSATYEKLRSMHLIAMAEAYRQQMADPSMNQLSFVERMSLLTDIEWNQRHSNRISRIIKNARFDQPQANVAEINFDAGRQLNRDQILALASCSFIQDSLNVAVMGPSGAGKTYLGCALGMEACKQSYSVQYARLPKLLEELKLAALTGDQMTALKKLEKVNLLILDDWMLFKVDSDEARLIYEIVYRRHRRASTIFCSQFSPKGWHQRIPETTTADGILDRIINSAYMIEIKCPPNLPSMRKNILDTL